MVILPSYAQRGADDGEETARPGLTVLQALVPDELTFAPTVTIMDGAAHEYVYDDDRTLSELVWDMRPLVLYGAELGLAWDRGPVLAVAGNAARPGNTGAAFDYDWLNKPIDGTDDLTHLATGDANLEFAYTANLSAGWRFTPIKDRATKGRLSITPGIGFRYMIWKWGLVDGYAQYAEIPDNRSWPPYTVWSEDVYKEPIHGTPISYLQEWWMPELSLAVDADLNERVSVGASARGTLWANCNGVDHHFSRVIGPDMTFGDESWTLFYDQLSNGWLFEPGVSATIRAMDRLALKFGWSRTYTSTLRGDTYKQTSSSDAVYVFEQGVGDGGGGKLEADTVTASIVVTLR